jgi:glyoxylase-like metal-dependent hydrolase (beta-lactamase superfamily II)
MANRTTKVKWLVMLTASVVGILITATTPITQARQAKNAPLPAFRLYVFDCGTLHYNNADNYQLKVQEVKDTNMSMACYLVVHPRGTLMWDVGAIPDSGWKPTGAPVRFQFRLPDGGERDVTMRKTLKAQLSASGFTPGDITYLAISHYHWDHVANANDFAKSTWLARKAERDIMFAANVERTIPANYSALRNSKTTIIDKDDFDVFGDGKAVLKSTPGHTPGHQVLYLELPRTGRIVLGGDLYHYPEERTLNRLPTRDFDVKQTAASRTALDAFLKRTGAQLWIQHDNVADARLRKAPEFYD